MGKMVLPGIEKLGRGHYRVWWTERVTRKRRSRVLRDSTLEDAKRVRASILDSQERGTYVTSDEVTVREYFDAWIQRRRMMGEARDSTLDRYEQLLDSVSSRLGDKRLQDLTRQDLEDYYAWCLAHERTRMKDSDGECRIVGPDTVNKRHKVVKQALDDAVNQEPPLIVRNPAARAAKPGPSKPRAQAFTADEAQAVSAAVWESWLELPVSIALHTGLRIGEVCGLRWKDLKLPTQGGGTITVAGQVTEGADVDVRPFAKTSASVRTLSCGVVLANILRAHRKAQAEVRLALGPAWEEPGDLVVCGSYGQVLRPSKISSRFTAVVSELEALGIVSTSGATFHTLRHTHATLLLRARVPVHVVSKRLGHSRIQTTLDRYAHVIPSDDEAAAAEFDAVISSSFDRTEDMLETTPSGCNDCSAQRG